MEFIRDDFFKRVTLGNPLGPMNTHTQKVIFCLLIDKIIVITFTWSLAAAFCRSARRVLGNKF